MLLIIYCILSLLQAKDCIFLTHICKISKVNRIMRNAIKRHDIKTDDLNVDPNSTWLNPGIKNI